MRPREATREQRVLAALAKEATAEPVPVLDWDRIERAIEARAAEMPSGGAAKPRRGRWALAGGLVMAVAAAAVALAMAGRSGMLRARRSGGTPFGRAPAVEGADSARDRGGVRDGQTLAPGAVVVAGGEPITYRHEGRVTWTALAGSRVRVASVGEVVELALEQGTVHAEVVPQPRPESFVVVVGGTRVAVHGTSFTVARIDGRADVEVFHGSVAVGPADDPSADARAPSEARWLLEGGDHAAFSLDGGLEVRWIRRASDPVSGAQDIGVEPPGSARPEARRPTPAAQVEPAQRSGWAPVGSAGSAASPAGRAPDTDQVLARIVDDIARCYERQVASAGVEFSVESRLTVVVGPSGAVKSDRFDPPLSPTLMSCADEAIAAASFPRQASVRTFRRAIHLSTHTLPRTAPQ